MASARRRIIVMGVAGAGKSSVGAALADQLGGRFFDGDDLHPEANVAKMSRGEALTDDDRWPWLDRVGAEVARGDAAIGACSALRRAYRDRIAAAAAEPVFFLHLAGPKSLIAERMSARAGHFMPLSLLDSQFATLEPPGSDEPAARVDISPPLEEVVAEAVRSLGA